MHGGTYAPVTETTKPNLYLKNLEERDIYTPSGRLLTLINPAYMTRQVYEIAEEDYPIKGHLTSLNPIRPENAPSPWEIEALESFKKGATEYRSLSGTGEEEYYRLMWPLFAEKSCLKCHAEQGYKEGDLKGGISVSVPLAQYNKVSENTIRIIGIAYSLIYLMGLVVLILIFYMLNRQYHRRKNIEGQLKFQAKLLDTVEQSVTSTDINGKILYWNPYSERLYGWKKSEVLGADLKNLIVPSAFKKNADEVYNVVNKGKSWSGEVNVQNNSGDIFPVLLTASPIYDEAGKVTGGISISIDITDKKKMEAQLRQTQKMEGLGTLAGGIAHDFNNILSPIILHSQMALEDMSPDDPLQTNIHEIYKAAKRARELVKQILTFARKGQDNRIKFKASPVIKEDIKFLRSTIPTTIDIRYLKKTDHDTIYANPTELDQVVMNLCPNAAYSMKEDGGIIEVILDSINLRKDRNDGRVDLKKGRYFTLTVKDSGAGISSDLLNKIFEPYFTTKKSGEGTGMGLAIIHGIVKNYGGDISVESTPGKGTTFIIYIPLVDEESISEEEQKTDILKGSGQILFVDDEKAAVSATKKILIKLGYNPTATTSSPEALEIFKKVPELYDLVITDMTMPGMTGKALTEKIREIRPDVPVILCTGYSDQIDEEIAQQIGIDEFLIKPINISELALAIRKVLDKKNNKS